jgi:hypothetical protein
MIEIVAALTGAIIGSVLTLVYSGVHESIALRRERKIIKNTLFSECELQSRVLTVLEKRYKQSSSVNPVRVALDLFEHGLSRHMAVFGNIVLIQKLSQFIVNVRALNMALDRYEPELLKALADTRRMANVENMRIGICNSIILCKKTLQVVQSTLKNYD